MASVEGDEWMNGQMGGVWMKDGGSRLLLNKFRVLGVSGGVSGFHSFHRYCTCNNFAPLVPLQ